MAFSLRSKTVILFAVSLCLGVLLLEGILRFQPIRRYLVTIQKMPRIYEADPVLGYRYRPSSSDRLIRYDEIDNLVTINSTGSHDSERDLGDAVKKRILAVGDSFTACLEVPVEKTWTRILEKDLDEHGVKDTQVINLGLDGTGTDVHLKILERYLESHRVDLVLLLFYENDLDDSLYSLWYRECYGDYVLLYQTQAQKQAIVQKIEASLYRRDPVRALYRLSCIFRVLVNLADPHNLLWNNLATPLALSPPSPLAKAPAGEHRVKEYMGRFLELARANGFVFAVVPVPCLSDPKKSDRMLREALSGEAIADDPVILDVTEPLQAALTRDGRRYGEMFWTHDNHLNPYGNEVFAGALCETLKRARLIRPAPLEGSM